MSGNLPIDFSEVEQMDTDRVDMLKSNLENLRIRLKNFSVVDRNGKTIGEVRDLTLDPAQNLSLIVSQPDVYKGYRFVLLGSKLIQKVDGHTRSLTINLSQADISYLPDYQFSPTGESRSTTLPLATTRPPQPIVPTEAQNTEPVIQPTSDGSFVESRVNDLLEYSSTPKVMANPVDRDDTQLSTEASLNAAEIDDRSTASEIDASSSASAPINTEFADEQIVSLLEERLVVNPKRRKLGEVIVRKEIETQMVEVPVRREKLIIERTGDEPERLAEIDLGQGEIAGLEIQGTGLGDTTQPTVRGEFTSPKVASQLLDAIAKLHHHGCQSIRIELVLRDTKLQDTYQEWFEHYSNQG
jgi:stress response protein YsnF/sporulation protein YlmC with PRC-barrel domain